MKNTWESNIKPSFWAKKHESNGVYKWLPLKQHLIDVMEVSGMLWHHWISRGQKELIMSSMDSSSEEVAYQLVKFLGASHDLAKATYVFQAKLGFNNSNDLDQELIDRLRKEGFEDVNLFVGPYGNRSHHALAGQTLLTSYGVRDDIASIIGGHHGKPIDEKKTIRDQKGYTANYFQVEDKESPIYQRWDKEQRALFAWALSQAGFETVESLPKITQTGQVLLEGLLIMADWIASNESYFPLFDLEQYEPRNQQQRKENGWRKWKPTCNWDAQAIDDIAEAYDNRFGFDPKELQTKLAETLEEIWEPGMVIIEAPMGGGKTEAALIAAEQLAEKTGRGGVFFGLPTQATSDGIFDRIKSWTDRIGKLTDESKSIQLVHGKSALNENYKSLARNIDSDGDRHAGVLVNEWFSGRKTAVLDDFVVGTIDQFLMTALKQKHLALRHLGFSKKVVILDEVHAYDAYMSQYLNKALEWLGAYKVPVVILSATLPTATRVSLMKSYIRGTGVKWKAEIQAPKDWETNDAYPLITYNDDTSIYQKMDFISEPNKNIKIIRLKNEDLLVKVKEIIHNDGVLGIVVNTVNRAQDLAREYSEVFGADKVQLLHSNFIATDRVKKEKDLLDSIGKNVKRPDKQIIIGTQVIEQSLDIDFDVLISDLAPMDLLLQRVGRLHRHKIDDRPEAHRNPTLYVVGTSETGEFEGGSSAVYGDYLLMRTQFVLPDVIALPADISKLVQKVYKEDAIEFTPELHQKYTKAKEDHEKKIKKQKSKASNYQIAKPSTMKNVSLIGWLKYAAKVNSEEEGSAQVRDTEASIEVIALKKQGSGYTIFGEKQDYTEEITTVNISKEVAKQTLRLPRALAKPYRIDKTIEELERFNMSKLAKWQELPWLRGSLGIIFDENDQFILNGYKLTYDEQLGLLHEKEGENGTF